MFALPPLRQFEFSPFLPSVPKTRPVRAVKPAPAASAGRVVVDHGFIPVRAKLIEVAAFLDRVERHAIADDFRCAALREAAHERKIDWANVGDMTRAREFTVEAAWALGAITSAEAKAKHGVIL